MAKFQLKTNEVDLTVSWEINQDDDGVHLIAKATKGHYVGNRIAVLTIREDGNHERYPILCPLLRKALYLNPENDFRINFSVAEKRA